MTTPHLAVSAGEVFVMLDLYSGASPLHLKRSYSLVH
jgi:hypothetical protein